MVYLKGLLLLSGGFDSAVAGYLAKEGGAELFAVHFSFEPILSNESTIKAEKLAKFLNVEKFFVIKIGKALESISSNCDRKFYFVLMKRLMFRLAEKIAEREKLDFLISGENLGQVSSQTLKNLSVIDQAVSIPAIRPLLCFEKLEIIDLAKKIGTYETSVGKEMCDILGPNHPATKSSLEKILAEEKKLELNELLEKMLNEF